MRKINGKVFLSSAIFLLLIAFLIVTRFINLGWGLPYFMHPDERNMANAIQQLSCRFSSTNFKLIYLDVKNCFNPRFFAYGQFPLYLGYLMIWISDGYKKFGSLLVDAGQAILVLRIISAVASILNVYVLVNIIRLFSKNKGNLFLILLLAIFPPFFIQFSHFGTTESILMLFYSAIIYYSLKLLSLNKKNPGSTSNKFKTLFILAIISGLAIGTKVSSGIFVIPPLFALLSYIKNKKTKIYLKLFELIFLGVYFSALTMIFSILFSPQNLINLNDFLGSMNYESGVALGTELVFYTRQFVNTIPVVFQISKIFPYVFGWPLFLLSIAGFFCFSWNNRFYNFLRIAILVYFFPTAFIFAKWSRFMTPILPLILIFAILTVIKIKNTILKIDYNQHKFLYLIANSAFFVLIISAVIPGLSYLSIYEKPDVRFQASNWIYRNIPENSYILSETANVVDIPVGEYPGLKTQVKGYQVISFNFYDLDSNPQLQAELTNHLSKADYIFIPSRRLFANQTCEFGFNQPIRLLGISIDTGNKCQLLEQAYPQLNDYYRQLFSGKLGFKEVAEFESYPQLNFHFSSFNWWWKFPDEHAEETWTVFDHPVIRIYKKIKTF